MNDRIMKLLALADSPYDNEAIVAFRTARRIMKESNLDWSGLIKNKGSNFDLNLSADVVKLTNLKLQLQKECYEIQDKITKNKIHLAELERKVAVAEEESEGFSSKKHEPDGRDIDEAFRVISNALDYYGGKKNKFIESLKSQWKEKHWLSPKQIASLRECFIRYAGFEPAW